LFWKRGPATASGQIPGVPVTWKFSGAAAIFTVVLLIFYLINPLKPFSDYKKIVIIHSTQDVSSSPTEASSLTDKASFTLDKSLLSSVDQKAIPFNSQTLQIELVPADSVYVLVPELTENSFRTNKPIPKGWYDIRFTSSETSQSRKYTVEVK